jgi:hypothetical protein
MEYQPAYLESEIVVGRWPKKMHRKLASGFILRGKFGKLFPYTFYIWLHPTWCFHEWAQPSVRSGPVGLSVFDDLRLDLILEGVEEGFGRQAASDNQTEIVRSVVGFVILPDSVDI